ncbi:hypothetical protein MJO28_013026, partial [Puccinia striiformis f. sp. tritici]
IIYEITTIKTTINNINNKSIVSLFTFLKPIIYKHQLPPICNPTSAAILPSSSSSADPAVFRPKLNDHHLPANIRAGSTDLETNNSSNKFS